jgi:Ulp1 family protease
LKRKKILYYDSYHAENLNILEKIFTSLDLENVAAFGVELYRPDWKLNCVMNTPLQRNGVDCGCHALIIAENISRRCLNFDFQTKEINSYREKIAYEIIAGNLFEQKLCADF